MKLRVVKKQFNSRMCFVCGFKNDLSVKSRFYELEDKSLCAIVCFTDIHQGYPGRAHGGVASSVIDETIGRAMMPYSGLELWGVTMSLNLKYKKPIPLDTDIRVVGRITFSNGRVFEGAGEILLPDNSIAVTATGKYLQMPLSSIADLDPNDEEDWRIVEEDNDPSEIEIP